MAILDNRTKLSGFETGDTPAAPDDLTGSVVSTADTEIYIEGARSFGWYTTTTRDGLLYDAGSAQNWAGSTFYFWINCGVVGLLDTLANGGIAARFCGTTVSDWFEVNLGGSNAYPIAQAGGWVMFVVDIDKAKTASDRTNGTPPATSAIRYAGITTITSATMPRMVSNTWLDACWRLPASTPGVLVEGQNTGSPWTWADIQAASDSGAWGVANPAPGGAIALNTPVRFGKNDAVTHEFADTNAVVLWEDWDVDADFYGLEVIGGSGTQSFDLGLKTGTGDTATGAQGGVIAAAAAGQRWYFDVDDANVDACNLYGVQFIHGAGFLLNDPQVSAISCLFIDCTSALVSNVGDFLRCSIVDANTADGVAFLTTDDLTDIVFCSFFFSDGHGIELTTPRVASQTSKGNRFSGYGAIASNDASVYNNSAGAVTITLSDGATSAEHTYRDGTSASTSIVAGAVTLTIICLDGITPVQNVRVLIWCSGTGGLPSGDPVSIVQSGGTATVTHTAHGRTTGDEMRVKGAAESEYNGVHIITVTGANTYTYVVDSGAASPATGSPVASLVLINGLTNASGVISDTRSYPSDQDITGRAVKGTSSPVYVPGDITGTVDSADGLPFTVALVADE